VTDQPERTDPYLEIASLLIERGADVNAKEWEFGGTALHIAAGWGHEAMAKLLLAGGANINTIDYDGKNGRTPLDEARRNGMATMVELLLKYGAKEGTAGST
jgi:ankyrin repeat protein